jgi:hypothetical protein
LQNKPWDQAVEDRAIIVAIQAMLEEVSASERCLLCPELEADVAGGGIQNTGGCGLRFEVVERGHSLCKSRGIAEVLQINEAFADG